MFDKGKKQQHYKLMEQEDCQLNNASTNSLSQVRLLILSATPSLDQTQ